MLFHCSYLPIPILTRPISNMSTTKRRSFQVRNIASEAEKQTRLEKEERKDLSDFSDSKPDDILLNYAAIPQQFLLTFINTGGDFNEEAFHHVKLSGMQIKVKSQALSEKLISYGNIPGGDYVYFAPSLIDRVREVMGTFPEKDMGTFVSSLSTYR